MVLLTLLLMGCLMVGIVNVIVNGIVNGRDWYQ